MPFQLNPGRRFIEKISQAGLGVKKAAIERLDSDGFIFLDIRTEINNAHITALGIVHAVSAIDRLSPAKEFGFR